MDGWTDGLDRWMDGLTDKMDGWTDGRMGINGEGAAVEGWRQGGTDGWVGR